MISQREARRLKKEVARLRQAFEAQRRVWGQEYLGGVEIARVTTNVEVATAIRTARKLSHAVVVIGEDGDLLRYMALPHYKADR